MPIEVGIKGRAETVVTEQNTAAAIGSGLVPVFATPYMIALMENAAVNALAPYLEAGQGSVGTRLEVSHDAATPIGLKVWAEAEIYAVSENGKIVDFKVKAWDEKGTIGQGTHSRAIIDNDRFLTKCNAKLEG